MLAEVGDVEKMLRDSTFYAPVSNEEKAAVYAAMSHDFRGTGHWYYCANEHSLRLEIATCRCRHLNARSVVLLSAVTTIRLLRESHERRTWRHNSVDRRSGVRISCILYNFATDAF